MITLEGVDKFFGDFQALRDVNLVVGKQEVVCVIGPSGGGKSTMIRCVNRLEAHSSGTIIVDGIELSDDVRNIQEIRRECGMVFQSFNLFPHMTVLDNVTLGPRRVRKKSKADAEAEAMELLERVKIPEQAKSSPGSSREASSSGSPSPGRSRCSRRSCSSTSPPRPSTPRW